MRDQRFVHLQDPDMVLLIYSWTDITKDVVLYRYSESKLLDLLRTKAGKLAEPEIFLSFPSLSRPLARLGLRSEQDFSVITNGLANREQFESLAVCEYHLGL